MEEYKNTLVEENTTPTSWRRIWFGVGVGSVLVFVVMGGLYVYGYSYRDRVLPGVSIGSIPVAGMSESELTGFLQNMLNKLIDDQLRFVFENEDKISEFSLYPVIVTDGAVFDLVQIDIPTEVNSVLAYGKGKNSLTTALAAVKSIVTTPQLSLQSVKIDQERITEELKEYISQYEVMPKTAGVEIVSFQPLVYSITTSSVGHVFRYDQFVGQVVAAWSRLESPQIVIKREDIYPQVKEDDVKKIIDRLPKVLERGSITIGFKDSGTNKIYDWSVGSDTLRHWLEVQKVEDNKFVFGLNKDQVLNYINSVIVTKVNVEARDAKFKISATGLVEEFQVSRPGVKVDVDKTYGLLNEAFVQRTYRDEGVGKSIQLSVVQTEPNTTTGEANNLGITEILGQGLSNFSGSPTNRIKNIRNAVKKLNGVLVKPGDDFSAITYTQPYTLEGGYLPELVIKGNEIKPEIGGGLCQIGTTLFRMAMNSGLPIISRRNHSLVIGYYNDLENGLPGTDATIYEPAPDFKFKNDTGHHILIETNMNVDTGFLTFTLWGTSDGRKGYYEKPVVKRWIPHGETKIIETTKLAPGEKQCQHAYIGAETSFTYIRELPDGTKDETVYESYYRPLPEICLVGVESLNKCQELPDGSAGCAVEEENKFNVDGSPVIVE